MSGDSFQLVIDAQVVAWYAAIVSTLLLALRFADYRRDRVKVKVRVRTHQLTFNFPGIEKDELVTTLTVTNSGRRPVTICNLIGRALRTNRGWVFPSSTPDLPCELTEGRHLIGTFKESGFDFDDVSYFAAVDASDQEYRAYAAPWYKRAFWNIRRRFT